MSRYVMDKLMRRVNGNEQALAEYVRDPSAFVQAWERETGQSLSDDERAAFSARDYGRLYALGAHPFLLWSFTQAIWENEVPLEALIHDYKEKARPLGYPEFTT